MTETISAAAGAQPIVSCIVATGNRRMLLERLIRHYRRQDYVERELVVVDDGADPMLDVELEARDVRYFRLDRNVSMGHKLNIAAANARARIIQKLDDDDYYHPDFLTTTVNRLQTYENSKVMIGFDSFPVYLTKTGQLKFSGSGWFAGGTLCFHKDVWERTAFRDLSTAVDFWFLNDSNAQQIMVLNSSSYVLVRHDLGHAWTMHGSVEVTEFFRNQPDYHKPLDVIMSEDDCAFYRKLVSLT